MRRKATSFRFLKNPKPTAFRPTNINSGIYGINYSRGIITNKTNPKGNAKAKAPAPKLQKFTAEEINTVKAAIQRARQDMEEWNEWAQVDPDKMKEPLTR